MMSHDFSFFIDYISNYICLELIEWLFLIPKQYKQSQSHLHFIIQCSNCIQFEEFVKRLWRYCVRYKYHPKLFYGKT